MTNLLNLPADRLLTFDEIDNLYSGFQNFEKAVKSSREATIHFFDTFLNYHNDPWDEDVEEYFTISTSFGKRDFTLVEEVSREITAFLKSNGYKVQRQNDGPHCFWKCGAEGNKTHLIFNPYWTTQKMVLRDWYELEDVLLYYKASKEQITQKVIDKELIEFRARHYTEKQKAQAVYAIEEINKMNGYV